MSLKEELLNLQKARSELEDRIKKLLDDFEVQNGGAIIDEINLGVDSSGKNTVSIKLSILSILL